jgi:TPR repeat protein
MDESTLCLHCFATLQEERVCRACGGQRGAASAADGALAPGTMLNARYSVGRVLWQDGFGITYQGWDARRKRRCSIKEYCPVGVAARNDDRTAISAVPGQAGRLADGVEAFLTQARQLARFADHPGLIAPRDFFAANGSAYRIVDPLAGETLAHYLERRGGRIAYAPALALLEPVLRALVTLHAEKVLHRAVSPENVFVTTDGEARLDSGGPHERSAAPEQGSESGVEGPWSDVYAVGATLYRVIAGAHPPRARDRLANDSLQPPSALGAVLAPTCERALLAALALEPGRRPPIDLLQAGLRGDVDLAAQTDEPTPPARSSAPLHLLWSALFASSVAAAVTVSSVAPSKSVETPAPIAAQTEVPERLLEPPLEETRARSSEKDRARARSAATAAAIRARTGQIPAAMPAREPAPLPDLAEPVAAPVAPVAPLPSLAAAPPPDASAPVASAPAPSAPATPTPVASEPVLPPSVAPPAAAPAAVPDTTGRLVVRANVDGSTIAIDGIERSAEERASLLLEPGVHRVRVYKLGYIPFEAEFALDAGEEQIVEVSLAIDTAFVEELYREGLRLLGGPEAAPDEAIRRLRRAADLDHERAVATLGELYAYGQLAEGTPRVVAPDDERALAFHRRAAARGDVGAQSRVASRLEDGRWPERRVRLLPSVDAGAPSAGRSASTGTQSFLTALRESQRGGEPAALPEVVRLHQAAAEGGSTRSQKRLAQLYAAGVGVPRDDALALRWFLAAARQGDAESQFSAGMCHALGIGTPSDLVAAQCWLGKAASQRYAPARTELERRGLSAAALDPPAECDAARP